VRRDRDPSDRRRRGISLTDTGREALDRFDQAIAEAQDAVLGAFDPEDRARLLDLLSRLVTRPEPGPGRTTWCPAPGDPARICGESFKDLVGALVPGERTWVVVPGPGPVPDVAFEGLEVLVDPAAEWLVGQQPEPAPDLVEPGEVGR